MIVAKVEYTGRMRQKRQRGYRFSGRPVEVRDVEDAKYFEKKPNFDVSWTPLGAIAKSTQGEFTEVTEALSDLGWDALRSLASDMGIETHQRKRAELEAELEEHVEGLRQAFENQ